MLLSVEKTVKCNNEKLFPKRQSEIAQLISQVFVFPHANLDFYWHPEETLEHCFVVIASFGSWGDSVSHTEQNDTLPFIATPGVCPYYWLCVQSCSVLEISFLSFFWMKMVKILEANFMTVYHSIFTTNISPWRAKITKVSLKKKNSEKIQTEVLCRNLWRTQVSSGSFPFTAWNRRNESL